MSKTAKMAVLTQNDPKTAKNDQKQPQNSCFCPKNDLKMTYFNMVKNTILAEIVLFPCFTRSIKSTFQEWKILKWSYFLSSDSLSGASEFEPKWLPGSVSGKLKKHPRHLFLDPFDKVQKRPKWLKMAILAVFDTSHYWLPIIQVVKNGQKQ